MKWGLNWFLIEIGFEIYWSSVLNSLLNSKWTRSSFLKLESSRKQLGNHTAVCKPATVIQQFYFTGDSRFFVSGVNINFKVQSKFLTSAEVISSSLPSFLIICFCYHGIWTINPRPWDPLPKVAYQGKGIYTFDIKFKWSIRQNAWECLDMSKVSIINFTVSVMLLWIVTLNLCRCVTVYGIKIDITNSTSILFLHKNALLKFYLKHQTFNAIATLRVLFVECWIRLQLENFQGIRAPR